MKIECWRCRFASWKNASWRRASSRMIWKKNRKFSTGPEKPPAWRPWTSERWRSRCDALEESLISNANQQHVRCLRSSLYFNNHLLDSNSLCRTGLLSACKIANVLFSLFVKNSPWTQRSRRRRRERWVRRKKWMINRGKVKKKKRMENRGACWNPQYRGGNCDWLDSGKTSASFPLKPQPASSCPIHTSPTPVYPYLTLYTLNPPNQTPEPHLTHSLIQTLYSSPSPSRT